MRALAISLSVVGFALSAVNAKAADCHIDPYSFHYGTDSSAHMTVKSGKSCGSTISTKGGGLSSLVIAQAAQNGTASTPSTYRWEYKASRGFTGKDAFTVQLSGSGANNRGTRTSSGTTSIAVDVDVVP